MPSFIRRASWDGPSVLNVAIGSGTTIQRRDCRGHGGFPADLAGFAFWARRAILQALERWDAEHPRGHLAAEAKPAEKREQRKVAESKPSSQAKSPTKRKSRE